MSLVPQPVVAVGSGPTLGKLFRGSRLLKPVVSWLWPSLRQVASGRLGPPLRFLRDLNSVSAQIRQILPAQWVVMEASGFLRISSDLRLPSG